MANPALSWTDASTPVAELGSEARSEFIRKTYVHFLMGLMAFSVVVYGLFQMPGLLEKFSSNYLALGIALFALSIGYRWLFASANLAVHYLGFALTIVLQAAICAPFFFLAERAVPGVLQQAFILTTVAFGGLTAVVLMTKKDFSFLGGALTILTFGLIGVSILGLIFSWDTLSWQPIAALVIFGGWVLYDTSVIQRTLAMNQYVYGATMLFIDFVVMLKNIVFLLVQNDD